VPSDRQSEQERLNRIERLIKQVAEASGQLQEELARARQLAAERAHASKPHMYPPGRSVPARRRGKPRPHGKRG
jgi:hypothetical protein